MLCYVMLRYVTLRYVTLRYVKLCYVMLCYVTLRYVCILTPNEKLTMCKISAKVSHTLREKETTALRIELSFTHEMSGKKTFIKYLISLQPNKIPDSDFLF